MVLAVERFDLIVIRHEIVQIRVGAQENWVGSFFTSFFLSRSVCFRDSQISNRYLIYTVYRCVFFSFFFSRCVFFSIFIL